VGGKIKPLTVLCS